MKKMEKQLLIEECEKSMLGHVYNKTLRTRTECRLYVMGYLDECKIDSVPIKLLRDIDELYYNFLLEA